jgi:hypothetical protein
MLSTSQKDLRDLTRGGGPLARGLNPKQFGRGFYSTEDKVKRNIVNYLLARPTTMSAAARPGQTGIIRLMQINELDQLIGRIGSAGGYSRIIQNEIKGAVASLKLMSYRANYQGQHQAMLRAIGADTALVEEMRGLVGQWGKFPRGRGWRSSAPDLRNARSALNNFADEVTYMEKFGSAWRRDPVGAIAGIFTNRGVKTGVSMAAYQLVNRLRSVLKLVGLDFPEGKYTSMSDMLVKGFVIKRILPIMAAGQVLSYADWQMDKRTGTGLYEGLFSGLVVEPTKLGSEVANATGMRSAAEWFGKVTGEEDRMNLLKYATMTPTEMSEFWSKGEVPIRRGRWWPLSPTPFEGQRTMAYIPNMYRRLQSRYQYTWEGTRGPEEEYFAHSWIPTPSYPLAPLNRLLDPYWFEKGTYFTRPYQRTGDFFTGPYGPLTPVLNMTIGQLIKPTKAMHADADAYVAAGLTQYGVPLQGVNWGAVPVAPLGGAELAHAQLREANTAVVGRAMASGGGIGQPFGIGAGATQLLMGAVGVPVNVVYASTPSGAWTEPRPVGQASDTAYRLQEMAGIYGFGVQAIRTRLGLSPEYKDISYMPRASEAYSFQSRFWNAQIGGMGDFVLPGASALSNVTFSEIFRRFVPRPPTSERVNPVANSVWQQNQWLPGPWSNYFEDFSVGDIYNRPYGALMLPGEAYNRAYGTQPNYEKGMYPYGPIDRLRMLSKVAPWSREYAAYNKSISHMNLTMQERQDYETIRAQVEDVNTKYRFAPYRFKNMELEQREYEIMGVTEEGYLQARGLGTPIKLAGLQAGGELYSQLQGMIQPGQRLSMQIDTNRPKFTMENDQRVLEAVVGDLNQQLLGQGAAEEQGGSPLSYYARTNELERTIGAAWETATHMWNPLTTKFIQRRSALEQYERTQVYGKDFAPWTHPYTSFVRPIMDSVGGHGFFGSIATGAIIGSMAGKGAMAKSLLSSLGGSVLGLNKGRTLAYEAITGDTWVPGHVKERWEQEEYMDVLQYVAAAKNYSLIRRRALAAGERDPEAVWQSEQAIKSWMAESKRNTSASIIERSVFGGVSKKEYFAQNPISAQAYEYRTEMGQTLYGANLSGGDYLSLQSALPKERRMYFEQFLNAPADERGRILSLLPRLERRIYQAAWGMEVERKPNLSEYFDNHYLPGPEAAIWTTGADWDKIRVRMIERAGGQPSEYGYYPQEVAQAEMYPMPVPSPNTMQIANIKSMLEQILGGSDINGLTIQVEPTSSPGFALDMNVTRNMYPVYEGMVNDRMNGI